MAISIGVRPSSEHLWRVTFHNINNSMDSTLPPYAAHQIAFAPLMIIFWGVEKFGIWLFLLSIPNILLVFNLNFNGASINEMTMFNSKKNYKKSNEIFQNSIIFTIINIFFF